MSDDPTEQGYIRALQRRLGSGSAPAVLLAVALMLAGGLALDQYNVTWDEALGDLFFGERYLWFFATLDERYLDFAAEVFPPERLPSLSISPFRNRPWEYYPFANVLAALTSTVVSGWLGVVDPFDGYHAVNLWLGAVLLVALYGFVRVEWGAYEAVVAVGLLFLSPRVICHMLANVKDFPEMVFFALTLLQFHRAWRGGSLLGMLLAGVFGGMALATKANALFLPLVIGPVALLARVAEARERWPSRSRLLVALAGAAAVAAAVMFAVWPWLWPDPIGRLSQHFRYLSGQVFQVRQESLLDPLLALSLTTTLPLLALLVVGLAVLVRPALERKASALLLWFWILVVLGRMYLPGAVNFDDVRHFLEVYPALAVAAGVGAGAVARRLHGALLRGRRDAAASGRILPASVPALVVLVLALGGSALDVVRTHPHEIAYWNPLIGGLSGAVRASIPQAGDYWGMSYRQGLRWINQHVEQEAVLAVPVIQHAVALVAPLRLRRDVALANVSVPNFPEIEPRRLAWLRALAAERPVYVMFVLREDWTNALMRDCLERLEPVAEWRLEGVPLLQIYRYR